MLINGSEPCREFPVILLALFKTLLGMLSSCYECCSLLDGDN